MPDYTVWDRSNKWGSVIRIDKFTLLAKREAGEAVYAAMNLVFPPRCLLCNRSLDDLNRASHPSHSHSLCLSCAALIEKDRDRPACPTCVASVAAYEVSAGKCAQCRRRRFRIAGMVRVGAYDETLGFIMRAHKYGGREAWQPLLARWLCAVVLQAPWLKEIEAVVSVPSHWRHRLGRPVYPATGLGRAVARATGVAHLPILRRTRAGPHQAGLGYEERTDNIRGAFAIRKGISLRDAVILLVDDVRTTGATLEECAKVLRDGGTKRVYAAVVLRAGDSTAYNRPKAESVNV